MTCIGGHGLSIGSIGGKSDNVVDGVTFSKSTVSNSENGCRIKTNSGTTGTVSLLYTPKFSHMLTDQQVKNIVYSDITLSGITKYGIDVQQDYLNGGPTGSPTNGVSIAGVTFTNVKGTVNSSAYNYYILCGSGSCSSFTFSGTSIIGGKSSCNYPSSKCIS
jgi:polygalacturonase